MRARASQCPGSQTHLSLAKVQKPEIQASASAGAVVMTSVLGGGGGLGAVTITVRVVVVVTGPVVVVTGPSGVIVVVVTERCVVTVDWLVGVRTVVWCEAHPLKRSPPTMVNDRMPSACLLISSLRLILTKRRPIGAKCDGEVCYRN